MPPKTPYDTNALIKQTQDMLAQTKQQGATAFAGSTYDTPQSRVGAVQAITPSAMTPATPINVPPTPQLTVPDTAGGMATITTNMGSLSGTPATEAPQDTGASASLQRLMDSFSPPPPSTESIYQNDYANTGIDAKQADVNLRRAEEGKAKQRLDALNAQLAGISAEATAIPIRIQEEAQAGGANVTKGGLAPIQTAQLRNNALRAIPIQAQVLGAQADLAYAQGNTALSQEILGQANERLNTLFQVHQKDAENMYNYKKDLRDRAYDFMTAQEKTKADAMQRADDRAYDLKKDAINNQQALSQIALESGQGELAGKIAGLDPDSKTFRQDIARLQGGIKDKKQELQLQLVQEQILTQRANRKNAEVDQLIEMAKLGDTGAQKALGITPSTSTKVPVTQKEAATLNQQITQNDNYKAIDKSISSWRALSEYEKLVNDVGATNRIVDPLDTGKSRAVWNTALLNLKEYYNLGVLNGPDLEIMQQLVPSNVKGVLGTVAGGIISDYITQKRVKDAIANQKVQFEDKLDTDYLSVRSQYRDYSPDQLTNLQDLDRKYLQMKSTIDPAIATFLKENPDLTMEEKLQVINTRL